MRMSMHTLVNWMPCRFRYIPEISIIQTSNARETSGKDADDAYAKSSPLRIHDSSYNEVVQGAALQ
jgi:hypothetical protein